MGWQLRNAMEDELDVLAILINFKLTFSETVNFAIILVFPW